MNVAYISSLPVGGPIAHLLELAPRVAALGVNVRVVCAGESVATGFRHQGLDTRVEPLRHKTDLVGASRVWQHLEGADIVHTHDRRAGLLIRPEARLRRAHAVHTVHGIPEEIAALVGVADPPAGATNSRLFVRAPNAWIRIHTEAWLARLGMTVVPSFALARFLTSHGFPQRRLAVVHNGVEVRRCEPTPRHQPLALACVGLLEHHKGIDVLLEACSLLDFPYRLEIFGDGAVRTELEAQAIQLGVHARFHGFVPDARTRVGEFDVLIHPSRAENLPIAILEAMASAVPVVASRVGGVPELVVDGGTGLLVSPDDPRALATAIARLHDDDSLRCTLGRAGAQRVSEQFDATETARRMIDLYARLA